MEWSKRQVRELALQALFAFDAQQDSSPDLQLKTFTAFGRTHADGLVFVARLEVVGTHARL